MEKHCFATFLPFRAPASSFFLRFLFSDLLSSSLLFPDSSHLCISSVRVVGILTSKLPSITTNMHADAAMDMERLFGAHGVAIIAAVGLA